MPIVLQVFLVACVLIFLAMIVYFLANKKLNLKFSLVWLAAGVGMLVVAIFPQIAAKVSSLIGIETTSNMVFLFAGLFMLLIIFTLTIIVSKMNNQIYSLTQRQAILEKRVREMESGQEENGGENSITKEEPSDNKR